MKKAFSKRLIAVLCATALTVGMLPAMASETAPQAAMVAGGWLESLFAEMPGVADADVTAVKYTGAMTGELKGEDLKYLVRDVNDGVRIDIPGLKAGKYDLTVTVSGKDYEAKDIQVESHDRSGFAHQTADANSACTPYTEGVGAYKDDGTLKDDAIVVYVTDENKETVSVTANNTTITGIGHILNVNSASDNNVKKFYKNLANNGRTPIVFRLVGDVTAPTGLTPRVDSTDAERQNGNNGFMAEILNAANVTIEGVGDDAVMNGWGVSFKVGNGDGEFGCGKNLEVRNLEFRNVPEDCVDVAGNQYKENCMVEHIWVHNCAFYVPHIDNPAAVDKAEGDGAVDFKLGQYMTLSYNYFEEYHKTSLIGGGDTQKQYHVTWHHNWWKGVQSRSPLARQADIHIYNNRYDGQTSYCMSLRANSYVFSEYNTFVNSCANPVKLEKSSGSSEPVGACKSFQDDFSGVKSGGTNQAVQVSAKAETVSSTNLYPNFDTASGSYVVKGDYKLDTEDRGEANIDAYGGVMKTSDKLNTVPLTEKSTTQPTATATAQPTATATAEPTATATTEPSAEPTATATAEPTATPTATPTPGGSGGSSGGGGGSRRPAATPTPAPTATATPAPEKPVTTVTTDDKGNTIETTVVSDGSKTEKVTTKEGDVTITAVDAKGETQATVKLPAVIPAPEVKFADVPENHWAAAAINNMAALGVVKGVNEEERFFDMESNITRSSVATILFRFSNGTEGKTNSFADVDEKMWYNDAVGWAAATGVVTGYSETAFGPEDTITREQMAVMLARYAKLVGLDTTAEDAVMAGFVDHERVNSWAKDGMAWCVKQGILKGRREDLLDPGAPVTRMEATAMLERMIALLK